VSTAVRTEIGRPPGVSEVDVASGEVRIVGEALPDGAVLRAAIETAGYGIAGQAGSLAAGSSRMPRRAGLPSRPLRSRPG